MTSNGPNLLASWKSRATSGGKVVTAPDRSNGYEAIADDFVRARRSGIGPRVVRAWAKRLTPGAFVLDIGCGSGIPITQILIEEGFNVFGVDASPTLAARFHANFPAVPIECNTAEDSDFFNRTYDAVVAWGLMFLLAPENQIAVISKAARALNPQGHFLFTAPREVCSWTDIMTGLPSVSLGSEAYERALTANRLTLSGNDEDEGENFYYFAERL